MKKTITYILAVTLVGLISSCSISVPLMITNNPIGAKMGKSTTAAIFTKAIPQATPLIPVRGTTIFNGIMFNKEFGIYEAAKNAGISKIATVDLRSDWYLFFTKKTIVVTGE